MATKEQRYAQATEQVACQVADSFEDWTGFLAMAGRLYKYPFDQQLLVYAQRPEAVACAEADLWEQRMRRHIRDGSRSIVIVDNSGKTPVLRYLFDVSDTEGGADARRPWLWEYREEHYGAVSAALEKRFGRSGEDDMAARLDEISERLAQEFWNDHKEDILDAVPGSFLEEFDEFNVETSFLRAASVSMAYALMSRCNLEPDEYFRREDFQSVFDFNTPEAISALGSAVSESSETILREIENAVKQYEREKQAERSGKDGHRPDLQAGRELSGSQSGFGRTAGASAGQIRPDAAGVSSGTQARPVDAAVRQRTAVFPSVGNRGGGQRPVGADASRAGGIGRRDGGTESPRPHALGRADERLQGAGGGNRLPGTDLLLRRSNPIEGQFSFFPTENEQIQPVSEPERARPAPRRETRNQSRTKAVPASGNFRITDDHLGEGTAKARFRANMDAIRTLKAIESEGRSATREEQEILSRYAGWGGLADAFDAGKRSWQREYLELADALTPEEYDAARSSTLNAFYTSPTVVKAIYEAVENMGFRTGNILEPSCGIGNFFGLLPDSMRESRLYGVELDSVTGRIARQLYPNADITISGFESTDRRDFFDLAIGNVPFGQYQVNDPAYNRLGFSIHNYFFAKALDEVRPSGVVAFVTSRHTLDAQSPEARKYIAKRAELLGAVRLPENAFKANAGTDVVADIVFLQKRDRLTDSEPDWVHLGRSANGFPINSYFAEHPEMILGRQSYRSTQYGEQKFTVKPFQGAELSELLREAVKRIGGTWQEADLPDLGENETVSKAIPADPNVRNYSYAIVDGEPYYRRDSVMVRAELSGTAKERVRGMVELRDCVRRLIDLQMDGRSPESAIREEQEKLSQLYDNFTARYGLINDRANRLAFSDDSAYYLLCSLEVLDEDGKLERKADFFTKRTIKQRRSVTRVDTAPDALAVSVGEKTRVDLEFMASLMGDAEKIPEIVESLRGVIYKDPDSGPFDYAEGGLCWKHGWQTADEYLSGNVRAKLRQARAAAVRFPEFQANVEALEKVQPKDLDASEIEVRLGSTWVDKEIFQRFMYETFDTPWYLKSLIQVKFSPVTAEWRITEKSAVGKADVAAYTTYGTERANAYKILEDSLNLRDVRIYDVVEDADGRPKRVLNAKETTLAAQKQTLIREEFKSWIWSDPVRRRKLVTQYNEEMNSTRPREYDGSHLVFSGMNPEITLREHQRNAIAHIIYGGNTLLAHEVGAGKTFEMVAAAMESKRLGLCSKSIFVVPNHLVDQWSAEFLRLYPSANLLVTTKKDFEKSNRKKFCARIATGSYDAVIIGQSQLSFITNVDFGRGLIKCGSSIVPFADTFPHNSTYRLLSTKASELGVSA